MMIMMNNWFECEAGPKVITVQTSETVLTVTLNIIISITEINMEDSLVVTFPCFMRCSMLQ